MAPNLEIIVGTYEQFLLGYTVDDAANEYKMKQSFATHTHLASIRSVASSKHYLASAGADDTVCLYDMKNRTESGKLVHHNETVNGIAFTPDGSHIITVSSDGTIGIVRCGSWQLEKHWLKPHKGLSVDTLAVHPTGKIAMTTGHDGVLRTWNLIKGRQAYATNLVPRWKLDAKNISALKWSPNGNSYLIAANNKLDIYSVETAGIEEELTYDSKIASVEYLDDNFVAVGLADGNISIYSLENSTKTNIQAHNARVKCLSCHENILVSASSSGEIKIWSVQKGKLILLNEVNCSARITCMTITSHLNLKCEKDEVEVEKVIEKTPNKLRLKQQVIIEDEGAEEIEIDIPKKNKKNKKKHKVCDNSSVEADIDTVKNKKLKTKKNGKLISKENECDVSDEPAVKIKKKKNSEKLIQNKEEKAIESDKVEPIKKKKKNKKNLTTKVTTINSNQVEENKKKRKATEEGIVGNLSKKQKVGTINAGAALLKKKRKKNFKNKISR